MEYKKHWKENFPIEMQTEYTKFCDYLYVEIEGYGDAPIQRENILDYNRKIGKHDNPEKYIIQNLRYFPPDGSPAVPILNEGKPIFIRKKNDPLKTIEGICISFLPPLNEYAKGFFDGYNKEIKAGFIDVLEARKELVINTAKQKLNECFFMDIQLISESDIQALYNSAQPEIDYRNFVKKNREKSIILKDLYRDGFYEGERYKAWEIILQTPTQFLDYFDIEKKNETLPPENPNIKENPQSKIDEPQKIEIFKNYFISKFKGIGHSENYFDNHFLVDLMKKRKSGIEYAQIAKLIYQSNELKPKYKEEPFRNFYKKLCDFLDIDMKSYDIGQITIDEELKNEFYYIK